MDVEIVVIRIVIGIGIGRWGSQRYISKKWFFNSRDRANV